MAVAVAMTAARWVVGLALAPVADTVLEAWAATKNLGENVEALKMELLYVQAMLGGGGSKDNNGALEALLQRLRDLAHDAEDVLDELDYFRIQDELDSTSKAAGEQSLILNAQHTAKATVHKLLWPPACCSTGAEADGEEVTTGSMRKLTSGACSTLRAVGKCLPCSSLPPTADDNDAPSHMPILLEEKTLKLKFNRVDISAKMKCIVDNMRPLRQAISEILRTIGKTPTNASDDMAQSRTITISESVEPKLHGRDTTMNSIIHDITMGIYCHKELTVLPIVGPGGIGKTTLTQYIYQNQKVQKHFDVKVWICVSLNFNVHKLIQEIEKYIPNVEGENIGGSGTPAELIIGQRIKSKRFLLVLDDMWKCSNEDEWEMLLLPFRKSQMKGNIIIVTTRFPMLARMVKTSNQSIELEGLQPEEFRELFLAFIFGAEKQSKGDPHIPMLLETGDKIMDKLKGNPLAAKTVGRLLRNQLDLNYWERILENKEWESQTGNHNIMPALKLSYDFLPFQLQQCFQYCALFPKDYQFGSQELIYFWIGLDVLESGGQNKSIEDIGLIALNDLVSYGFFKNEESDGNTYYLIHDLLHDLALNVAHDCLSIDRGNVTSLQLDSPVRHLSIMVDYEDGTDGITDGNFLSGLRTLMKGLKIEMLRTFMLFGSLDERFVDLSRDLIRNASSLRVLDLSGMCYRHLVDQSMLNIFSALSHLRYLSLENVHYGCDIHLPIMLSRLYHLRILDLENWHCCLDLLRDVSSLTKLRHIILTSYCSNSYGICNVGKLQHLQELERFEVKKESSGFELKQLGNLSELRELRICCLEKINTKEEAAEAKLIDKRRLLKLRLDWNDCANKNEGDVEGEILEGLQPHRNLQELCITRHGSSSCPTWLLNNKVSLRALHLDGVEWEVLPPLAHMRALYELTLVDMSTLKEFGPRHFGSVTEQRFCSLKRLTLVGLRGLEKWVIGEHSHLLSLLEVLVIRNCPNLVGLAFTDNIYYPPMQDEGGKTHWFPNLQELVIENCPKVVSLPPIPWTQTLCSVEIREVESSLLDVLYYTKTPSSVGLEIWGRNDAESLYEIEKALVFHNLRDLQSLHLRNCPPLGLKHFQVLTSLKYIEIFYGDDLVLSGNDGDVEWQSPIEELHVIYCRTIGKQLSRLISHLPKLSILTLHCCENITRIGKVVEQQQTTSLASPVRMEEDATPMIYHQHQKVDDKMLLLPAHLSGSLRKLHIRKCRELSLVTYPLALSNCSAECFINGLAGGGWERGGLQTLCSLKELTVQDCPKFLSAYKTSFSSSSSPFSCPFPSSLQNLEMIYVDGMGTLEPLSNLTSLDELVLHGEDFRSEGLWPLVTRGRLRRLSVIECPGFFIRSHPLRGLQGEDQQQLHPASQLQKLTTDDVAGFLVAPICSFHSSGLNMLTFHFNYYLECFTEEQEDALQLLTSLQDLQFHGLQNLQCLPAGLHRLPNLKRIDIYSCPAINSLPKDGLPVSLQELDVRFCDNKGLKQQCRNYIRHHPGIKLKILY